MMPIYEYSCPKCGTFEHFQKFTDPALLVCPQCGQPVKKLISRNIGIIYKAGGYYVSDNRSSEYKQKAKEDSTGMSSTSFDSNSSDSKAKSAAE